jgi:PAS domain S-box-containing protein
VPAALIATTATLLWASYAVEAARQRTTLIAVLLLIMGVAVSTRFRFRPQLRVDNELLVETQELHSSQPEVEANYDRFAAVAKATKDILWDWDLRSNRMWRNDGVKTLLGYDPAGAAGSTGWWLKHVAPEDRNRVEQGVRAALDGADAAWSSEYQFRRGDGSMALIYDRAIIVRDHWGQAVRMVGAMTDVTAQRRAEEGQERFAAILQASPDFVAIADAATMHIIWLNRAGRRMLGMGDEEDVTGVHIQSLQPSWAASSQLGEMLSTAAAGGTWAGDSALLHRNGEEIPVSQVVVAHRRADGSVEYFSTVARDIRERRHLEAQLLHAQKLESIGRLAGGVAHDFNNLLTAIIGYTELARAALEPEHPVQDDLVNVHDAARRSAALTRQLLAFARKQVIRPQVVELNDLIRRMETMLHRLIGEDIRLVTKLETNLAPVLIDPGQFEQVLMNLAVNARDAMPDGGTLLIETSDGRVDDAWAHRHPGTKPGEYGVVRVTDTGVGMTRDVMAHVFEPFFTTKDSGEGTGLGLPMCYGIIKQSGGSIWVTSEPGKGASFEIYLPRHDGKAEQSPDADREPAPQENTGAETILLIEDETFVRDLAHRALSSRGYRVLKAVDGPDAIEVARRFDGQIDLVLSDVVMPHMGVAELSAKLRQILPSVGILFMSGYSETAVYRHGVIEAGAGLIEKPFTPESLARRVREALDGKLT